MNKRGIHTNRLASENSPYLLMHAHNPVDWFPWGEEAFAKARDENKLLIVSIGYAACHWCHVMENESFSDEGVARIMNKNFISVKVDREERPDIDAIYMNAVQILSGQGGWPLNAILLPDGKPVFAITYLPRENWKGLLTQIQHLHETSHVELVQQAREITNRILQLSAQYVNPTERTNSNADAVDAAFRNLIKSIDFSNGGIHSAPKFPMPVVFEYLLQYFHFSKETEALEAVTLTLDKMAMGGIYDQIGGGFSRYSTDNQWKVPHFEKMLYDNAQLVSLYSHAFKLTQHEPYAQVIKEILGFIDREMTSAESAFYSAIDADAEGMEGKFYVWQYDTFKSLLDEDERFILDYYAVEKNGNWENELNILFRALSDDTFIAEKGLSPGSFEDRIIKIKKKLLDHRNNRVRPLTDTKVIASWNALMMNGCLDAYAALGTVDYLNMAIKNAQFIINKLIAGNSLYRNYKDGKCYTHAKLDDYAHFIRAMISLYQTTFDERWLDRANGLMEHTLLHFHDARSGLFFYTSDLDETLIARQFEITDQVIPSSNSVMALNLYYLGAICGKTDYTRLSEKMLSHVRESILESTAYFANWAKLQMLFVNTPFEVALVGEKCLELNGMLNRYYLPNTIVAGTRHKSNLPLLQHKFMENQTSIYICKDKVCSLPMTDVTEALKLIGNISPFAISSSGPKRP
jgi:uncharacterized protein